MRAGRLGSWRLSYADGPGKTYTAFQIIWRLWKAGRKKRILFLADRNVLIDQTMVNDFRPFGAAMAKLSTNAKTIERPDGSKEDLTLALDRKRRIDTAFEVYLGLYQAITGPEERQKLYREFSPGFFDLIVIDECHRGSAAEDSVWREILTHFSGATQIGLTATPKETEYVSNTDYFDEPVFTYSLKQGISDGFLSRDSQFGQRIMGPLAVEICDGVVDGVVERDGVGEGLVGEVMGLEVAPDRLDVIEFGRVFRQSLDSGPAGASRQRGKRAFAGVDRTIVLDQHDRLGLSPRLRAQK